MADVLRRRGFQLLSLPQCLSSSPKTLRSNYLPGTTWLGTDYANLSEVCLFHSVSHSVPSFSHYTFISGLLLVHPTTWHRPTPSTCSRVFLFSFFPLFYALWCCVYVFVSCALGGSFWLIKEMIYGSMMSEEFPDLSSNLLKWSLSSQPQSETLDTQDTCMHVCTHKYIYIV